MTAPTATCKLCGNTVTLVANEFPTSHLPGETGRYPAPRMDWSDENDSDGRGLECRANDGEAHETGYQRLDGRSFSIASSSASHLSLNARSLETVGNA